MNFKEVQVSVKGINCESVAMLKDVLDDEVGVYIAAWHNINGVFHFQSEFIEMPEYIVSQFISDYSRSSAENFIKHFKPNI